MTSKSELIAWRGCTELFVSSCFDMGVLRLFRLMDFLIDLQMLTLSCKLSFSGAAARHPAEAHENSRN